MTAVTPDCAGDRHGYLCEDPERIGRLDVDALNAL